MKLLQPDPIHIKLSEDWKYTHSSKTNVAKTIKKERDRLAQKPKILPGKVRELKRK